MPRHSSQISKSKTRVAVVIPARNEVLHLANLLQKLAKFKVPIVVVDDGSHDGTKEVAAQFTPYVLSHVVNLGKGAALRSGCDWAFSNLEVQAIVTMDADEQHDPAELSLFLSALKKGHSLVLGVRNLDQGMPKGVAIVNKLTSWLVKLGYGRYIPDIPSGYKAFSKEVYQEIKWQGKGYEMEIEIAMNIAQKKIKFTTVPITTIYHHYVRGMSFLDALEVLRKMLLRRLLTV